MITCDRCKKEIDLGRDLDTIVNAELQACGDCVKILYQGQQEIKKKMAALTKERYDNWEAEWKAGGGKNE